MGSNNIKSRGNAYALQCTKKARSIGLVDDTVEPPECAEMYLIAIDDLIIAMDRDIPVSERAAIVRSTAGDLGTIGAAAYSKVQVEGNGYQINLPRAVVNDAGQSVGMATSHRGCDRVLVIYPTSSSNTGHIQRLLDHRSAQADPATSTDDQADGDLSERIGMFEQSDGPWSLAPCVVSYEAESDERREELSILDYTAKDNHEYNYALTLEYEYESEAHSRIQIGCLGRLKTIGGNLVDVITASESNVVDAINLEVKADA